MNGIKFGSIHSYTDLNLILSSVSISPATPKMTFVDVPGADGSLDLTEALGEIKYKDREATFVFTTLPSDDIMTKYSQVSNALNGVRFEKIILDDDPNWYWTGRCYVSAHNKDYPISKITVTAKLNPWKMKRQITSVQASIGTEYSNISLTNSRKHVVPSITCETETTIKFGTTETTISTGTHVLLDIVLVEGNNTIQAKTTEGSSTIKILYGEGEL